MSSEPQGTARSESQTTADVAGRQVGIVYAKALLGASERAGQTEAILAELDSFVDDVLARFPGLEAVLVSRIVAHEAKCGLLDRTVGGQATPLFLNFLKVLSQHARFDAIRAVRQAAHELHDQLRQRLRVEVRTAAPLSGPALDRLRDQLQSKFQSELRLAPLVDPALLGGVLVRVGDTVFDGSLAAQLDQLREQMISRSVHEIQSRRDRFRHSEGN